MSRTPATFKQADAARAVKVLRAGGFDHVEIKFGKDGISVIGRKADTTSAAPANPYDEWKAANGSR
jgi:hypothetical protein